MLNRCSILGSVRSSLTCIRSNTTSPLPQFEQIIIRLQEALHLWPGSGGPGGPSVERRGDKVDLGAQPPASPDRPSADAPQVSTVHLTPDSPTLVDIKAPACRRLISHTFSQHEVVSLIEAIFTSPDEVKMIGCLRGDDAQTFVDAINEVCLFSFIFEARSNGPLTFKLPPFTFRLPGLGSPKCPTVAPEKVSERLMQDMLPPGFTSKIPANPTLLRPNGYPAISRRVRQCVEGRTSRPPCCSQGIEGLFDGRFH